MTTHTGLYWTELRIFLEVADAGSFQRAPHDQPLLRRPWGQ
jgi:hypothetical protein